MDTMETHPHRHIGALTAEVAMLKAALESERGRVREAQQEAQQESRLGDMLLVVFNAWTAHKRLDVLMEQARALLLTVRGDGT